MKITVEVCDVCHDREREVKGWRVAPPGGQVRRVVLCAEHEAPLVSLLPAVASHRRRGRRAVTREELDG